MFWLVVLTFISFLKHKFRVIHMEVPGTSILVINWVSAPPPSLPQPLMSRRPQRLGMVILGSRLFSPKMFCASSLSESIFFADPSFDIRHSRLTHLALSITWMSPSHQY